MATQLFFTAPPASIHRGTNSNRLSGVAGGWVSNLLSEARGNGVNNQATSTVAGATNGVEVGNNIEWISEPLAADVTIAGSITFNLRMLESAMAANVGAQCVIERLDHLGAIISTVIDSEQGVELGTAEAAQNWSASPTSTAFNKGDRIRVRVAGNDAGGTMASGNTFTFSYDGTTAAASGDSYVTFTETFSFMTASPAGSILYLTNVNGPAVGAAIEKEMRTARGDGVDSVIVNTATGWTAPIQWTDSAGGTVVEWYSKQLSAFTLAERVSLNIRALESSAAATAGLRMELATTDNDGSNVVIWAAANFNSDATVDRGELTNSEAAYVWHLGADDLAVSDGQRLRLRAYIDDTGNTPMVTGHTATLFYDGTSGGASGDSFITLTQTVSEFADATFPPVPSRMVPRRRISAHLTM